MKDYKHLANKLDRQREIDMTAYSWEGSSTRKKIGVACGFIIIAAIFLACFIGWIEEARADSDYNYYQSQQWLQRQQALEMMRRQEIMERNQQMQERRRGVDASIILDGTDNMPNYGESYIRGYELGRRYGQ